MGKAIPNEALKSALIKDGMADINNRGEDIIVSFFTGTAPLKSELIPHLQYFTDGWVHFNSVLNHITTTLGETELCRVEYNDFTYREHLEANKIRFNMSKRGDLFTPLADGVAGWFLMFEQDEGTAYATNRVVRWGCVGTVGLPESGADLILADTTFSTSRRFRMNDVTINANIQGTV